MNSELLITTQLKSNDAVAATAFHCLVDDMSWKPVLKAIQRNDMWLLDLKEAARPTPAAAIEFARDLARDTRVFVNPNKHIYQIYHPLKSFIWEVNPSPSLFRLKIRVTDYDDSIGRNALQTLHSLYSLSEMIQTVQFGVLWTVDLTANDLSGAAALAHEIALTHSHENGLLGNPHYQMISILTGTI